MPVLAYAKRLPRPLRDALLGATLLAATSVALAAVPAPARAQEDGDGQPILFVADEVTFDETLGLVIAAGNVELARGDRILLADRVTYNERTKVVTATGNVRLVEPSGHVVFSEYAELTDDLAEGFVDRVRMLMTDNARVAATEGERTDGGRYIRLNRAVYSPCNLCPEDPTRPPLWQMRAVRVVHDQQRREVVYRDATLEMFGVPVFYTPYFSHPDPSVDRQSGILAPAAGMSSSIGTFATVPYYWAIAPDRDATITPTISTEDGLHLRGEWRERFETGSLRLDGGIVNADRRTRSGQVKTDQWRGHLFGEGQMELDDTWRAGFRLEETSDDAYLRRYRVSSADALTSRLFTEGFRGRHYAALNAYRFNDLRPGIEDRRPTALPLASASLVGEPGALAGGHWFADASLLNLMRTDGRDTRRATSELGWERSIVANAGFITTLSGSLRSDVYYVTDFDRPGQPGDTKATTARVFPQTQVAVRYPLARQFGSVHQVIEPIAAVTLAPELDEDDDIPNEDSLDFELDRSNLFRPNRFPGRDRLESGSRLTYGFNTGFYGFRGGFTELFLGQSYRLNAEDDLPQGIGAEGEFSDVIGQLRVAPNNYLYLAYNFQLDQESLDPTLHDLTATGGPSILRAGVNYYFREARTGNLPTPEREFLTATVTSQFTDHWSASLGQRHDLTARQDSLLSTSAVLTYADECFTFQVIGIRDHSERADLDTGDTIYFRLIFKNLGEFEAPLLSGASQDLTY